MALTLGHGMSATPKTGKMGVVSSTTLLGKGYPLVPMEAYKDEALGLTYYRVPVEYRLVDPSADKYIIYTGEETIRILTVAELPNEIKFRMGLIRANGSFLNHSIWDLHNLPMTLSNFPEGFEEIGWLVSTTKDNIVYCIILEWNLLNTLRGESL